MDTVLDLHRGLPRGCSFARSQASRRWVGKVTGVTRLPPCSPCRPTWPSAVVPVAHSRAHSARVTLFLLISGEARLRPLPGAWRFPLQVLLVPDRPPAAPLDPGVRCPAAQEAACPHKHHTASGPVLHQLTEPPQLRGQKPRPSCQVLLVRAHSP